ncbi:MAG: hypothetical protein KGL16_10195 [Acidobacteriota bacterium]|nr:hypothetical protein [Acidobacteriota bacterium]
MASATVLASATAASAAAAHSGARGRRTVPAQRTASYASIEHFVKRAQQALDRPFTVSYRITLFKYRRHVFHGRVTDSSRSWKRFLFQERPAFFVYGNPEQAYEILGLPSGLGSCDRPRLDSRWRCWSDVGMGMGTGALEAQIAPQALVAGLSDAVDILAPGSSGPYPLFLGHATVDGRAVRCLSIGNPAGAVGRVCTLHGGMVASYRMSQAVWPGDYASAELLSYATTVRRGALRPPAKPVKAGS